MHCKLRETNLNRLETTINQLDIWLKSYGISGYDPYDIQDYYIQLMKNEVFFTTLERMKRSLIFKAENYYPLQVRRILHIDKKINAKAMGLFAAAYLRLYQSNSNDDCLKKALNCLEWLENNCSQGYSGFAWGYPFDWQSIVFIPKSMPSSVVSSAVGDAFWLAYKILKDDKYLQICNSICNFFVQDLNIDYIDEETLCFSYTPVDNFHVHNANLFVAEYLLRVGTEMNNHDYITKAKMAAHYALKEQNEDGSIFYWGKIQDHYGSKHLDHYHSGFEIRCLYNIWKITGDVRFYHSTEKYYKFYLNNFFDNRTIPKLTPSIKYNINIHGCAEALLCNSVLGADFPYGQEYLWNSYKWLIDNMQSKDGYFIYMIRDVKGLFKKKLDIPYIRWGEAWMMRGLAEMYYRTSIGDFKME